MNAKIDVLQNKDGSYRAYAIWNSMRLGVSQHYSDPDFAIREAYTILLNTSHVYGIAVPELVDLHIERGYEEAPSRMVQAIIDGRKIAVEDCQHISEIFGRWKDFPTYIASDSDWLIDSKNGVTHYSREHCNGHYIVFESRVFKYYGYHGLVAFDEMAAAGTLQVYLDRLNERMNLE